MKKIKRAKNRLFFMAFCIVTMAMACAGCSKEADKEDKLSIVTTLFPQYDFARQIAGDKADVVLLLNPGTEAHDYDPTPSDIIEINEADLFIYTGENMETWASTILNSIDNKNLNVLDVSEGITLYASEDDEEDDDEHEHEHEHEYDPHIWTSPKNAVIMMNNILNEIIAIDPDNKDYYESNANAYISRIENIDSEIREVVDNSQYDTIYFGGRFALLYFVKEYGLNYISAFDSCSSETEPSAKLVASIVDEMKKNGAKVVYYEELGNGKTAEAIADEIGGETLLLHSCHNISKAEMESGATYVSIMKQNIENLKIGLGYLEESN